MNITVKFGDIKPAKTAEAPVSADEVEASVKAYNEGKPVNPRDIFSPLYFAGGRSPALPSRRGKHVAENK